MGMLCQGCASRGEMGTGPPSLGNVATIKLSACLPARPPICRVRIPAKPPVRIAGRINDLLEKRAIFSKEPMRD